MSRPYRTQASAAECQSVAIPHDLVGYVPGRHRGYARLDAATPRGAMLAAAKSVLFDTGGGLDDDDAEALGDSFAGVVRRLLLGMNRQGYVGLGEPYLLGTIAAVVVGGTSILGGRGGYLGTIAGAILLVTLTALITVINASPGYRSILFGSLILVMLLIAGRGRETR